MDVARARAQQSFHRIRLAPQRHRLDHAGRALQRVHEAQRQRHIALVVRGAHTGRSLAVLVAKAREDAPEQRAVTHQACDAARVVHGGDVVRIGGRAAPGTVHAGLIISW